MNSEPPNRARQKDVVGDISLDDRLGAFAVEFDKRFDAYLIPSGGSPSELVEAIRYSALAPGKRIRPYLAVRCCELVGGRSDHAWPVAAAVECVHAFSLIHDDLPAMDDDDLRRGRPTAHKRFSEAIAILAGDALMVLSFELLNERVIDPASASAMTLELARGAGWSGMIGGQAADVLGESRSPSRELAEFIHHRKTASLFQAACRLGAIAGRADAGQIVALGRFGHDLGRAFQVTDDLLDETSSARAMGKNVGKDARAGKQTFPRCVGIQETRTAAQEAARSAVAALESFGPAADDLRCLADYVVYRDY